MRRRVVLLLLLLSPACGGAERPTAPTPTSQIDPLVRLPGPPPPASQPGRTYTLVGSATQYALASWTLGSQFVLFDDGTFVLQYTNGRDYRGRYEGSGSLTFHWEGWSIAGPWGATGSLEGDLLTVRYNLVMQLSDFEDAVYRRVP